MSDGPDPTLLVDGSRCPVCKQGVVVADPVEWAYPAIAKCRDCCAPYEGESSVPGGAEEFLDNALDELEAEGALSDLTERQMEVLRKDAARRRATRAKAKE